MHRVKESHMITAPPFGIFHPYLLILPFHCMIVSWDLMGIYTARHKQRLKLLPSMYYTSIVCD